MKEYKYKINGHEYKVNVGDIENNIAHIEVNGVSYNVELEEEKAIKPVVKRVAVSNDAPVAKPAAAKPAAAAGEFVIFVCILEAMKMGNEIHAGKDGVVKSINVAKDESVLEGTTIMIIA